MLSLHAARELHHVNAAQLAAALPQWRPFGRDERDDVIRAVQRWLGGNRTQYDTWQQAWNAWAGATPERAGLVTVPRTRCPDCGGRRYRLRHGRPGVCVTCLNGVRPVRTTALWQPEPACGRAAAAPPPEQSTPQLPAVGDRVKVTGVLPDDPSPLEVGDEGTVTWLGPGMGITQIGVCWDSGRTLMLLATDPFTIVSDHQ